MATCVDLKKKMLPGPVAVKTDDPNCSFTTARIIADQKVAELAENPMLLAWYDSTTKNFSPDVTCCSDDKPGWLVYSESRGGSISITINEEQFVFVYADVKTNKD